MSEFCLTLIGAAALEEPLLDLLLAHLEDGVFTSTPTFSHGTPPERMSGREQVMGRSRSIQIQALVTAEQLAALTALLAQRFGGTELRYWVCALSHDGAMS